MQILTHFLCTYASPRKLMRPLILLVVKLIKSDRFQLEAAIPSLRLDYQPLTWESEPALLPEGTKARPVRVVEIEPIPSPVADFDAHMPWVEQLSRQAPSVHQCQPSGVWQLSSGALHTVMSAAGMHSVPYQDQGSKWRPIQSQMRPKWFDWWPEVFKQSPNWSGLVQN